MRSTEVKAVSRKYSVFFFVSICVHLWLSLCRTFAGRVFFKQNFRIGRISEFFLGAYFQCFSFSVFQLLLLCGWERWILVFFRGREAGVLRHGEPVERGLGSVVGGRTFLERFFMLA